MVITAVAQFAPGDDKVANLEAIRGLAEVARRRDAALLVLPEFSSYMASELDQRFAAHAEPLDGPFVAAVGGLAKEHGLAVVVGMNERIDGEPRVHNTLVFVGSDGELRGVYRKLHLYDAFGYRESSWVQPGVVTDVTTMDVDGITFAAQTCYDLRFPEVTRTLVDAGADVVLVPAQWVPGPLKEEHWTTLLRARAIENTVYVAAADQAAPYGSGRSMIVDPMGVTLASLGERTGVAVADIDRWRVDEVRAKNPSLSARRFAVVEADRPDGDASPT